MLGSARAKVTFIPRTVLLRHSDDVLNLKQLSDVARLLFWHASEGGRPQGGNWRPKRLLAEVQCRPLISGRPVQGRGQANRSAKGRQSRQFDGQPVTSGVPPPTDIARPARASRFVPVLLQKLFGGQRLGRKTPRSEWFRPDFRAGLRRRVCPLGYSLGYGRHGSPLRAVSGRLDGPTGLPCGSRLRAGAAYPWA